MSAQTGATSGHSGSEIRHAVVTWGLNIEEATVALTVDASTFELWLIRGIDDHDPDTAALIEAAELLEHHLKPGRARDVVRRPATSLNGRSLVDILTTDGPHAALQAVTQMFQPGEYVT